MVTFMLIVDLPFFLIKADNNANINISHCAFLSGNLVVTISDNSQLGNRLPILNSQCINGTFSSVTVNYTEKSQCNAMSQLQYQPYIIVILFNIPKLCSSETVWIYITIGVVGFLCLVSIIVAVIIIYRKKSNDKKSILFFKNMIKRAE